MSPRDWDKELAKIDKHLASLPEDAPPPSAAPSGKPAGKPAGASQAPPGEPGRRSSTLGVFFRLLLAVGLGVAMLFWPYSARCGVGLFGYLFAALVVVVAGVWTAVWTWRHRWGQAHILSLLLIAWGLVLAAQEVLPRVGYARPDPAHPAIWVCE